MDEVGLRRYAAQKEVPLGTAEKDYVLSTVIMQLSKSQHARRFFVKGGTAIRKVYYPEARFSVDLDFNLFNVSPRTLIQDLSDLFADRSILEVSFKECREQEVTDEKVLIRLRYSAQLKHPDNVGLDFTFNEPLLTTPQEWTPRDDHDIARQMSCEHLAVIPWPRGGIADVAYSCRLRRMTASEHRRTCLDCRMEAPRRGEPHPSAFGAMSIEEILAEKVRACLTRARPRDLYDIWFLRSKGVALDRRIIVDKMRFYQEFRDSTPSLEQVRERLAPIENEWDRDLQSLIPAKSYPTFQVAKDDVLKGFSGVFV